MIEKNDLQNYINYNEQLSQNSSYFPTDEEKESITKIDNEKDNNSELKRVLSFLDVAPDREQKEKLIDEYINNFSKKYYLDVYSKGLVSKSFKENGLLANFDEEGLQNVKVYLDKEAEKDPNLKNTIKQIEESSPSDLKAKQEIIKNYIPIEKEKIDDMEKTFIYSKPLPTESIDIEEQEEIPEELQEDYKSMENLIREEYKLYSQDEINVVNVLKKIINYSKKPEQLDSITNSNEKDFYTSLVDIYIKKQEEKQLKSAQVKGLLLQDKNDYGFSYVVILTIIVTVLFFTLIFFTLN